MDTSITHLHLLLNHVPTVGTGVAIGVMLLGLVRRNEHLRHASLEVLFLVAVLTLPSYLTGVVASSQLAGTEGVSNRMIGAHYDAAIPAFFVMQLTGAAAWLSLWQFRRKVHAERVTAMVALFLAVVSMVMMGRAATLGGEIRHPEIRIDQAAEAAPLPGLAWLTSGSVTRLVEGSPWVWPASETLHFIGLCLSLGVLLAVNLRLLGVIKAFPFSYVHRLLPWGLLGFGINLVTGMVFFISAADRYTENPAFAWKIVFMMLAGANFLYLTVFDKTWELKAGGGARLSDRAIAVSSIVLWLGIIYWGRIIPFWPLE